MYFDSSALVKLLVDEPGDQLAREAWRVAPQRYTATVALPEVASALSRAVRGRRIRRASASRAWGTFEKLISEFAMIVPVARVAVHGAGYASLYALRGFDALHLACARSTGEAIVTFDRDLIAAASAEGLIVIGA